MPHSLIWLPDVLKNAGLKVATIEGWQDRGHGDVGNIFGVICHHTAGARTGNMPSLNLLINGRKARPATATSPAVSALAGPLSQLGLGRDGTYYVIAAGRCNHAGTGIWQGLSNGNSNFIGIEAENTGLANDFPWPPVQLEAYQRGVAAILKHIGRGPEFCAGHKEYALPLNRKIDPDLDMALFRVNVAAILGGTAPPLVLIPPVEPGTGGRPTLRRGDTGKFVEQVQAKVKVDVDGKFGAGTEAAVREFQRAQGLVADGIVGPRTWLALDTAV
jgi:peptidoglycan hydrolase-like protein with peptidoglycan-binding domain